MNVIRTRRLIATAGLLVAIGLASCQRNDPGVALAAGEPVPALPIRALAGTTRFEDALRGRFAVINVWATWCAPCREEMPKLAALTDDLKASDVAVITVNIDADVFRVREWLRDAGSTLPVFHDAHGEQAKAIWGLRAVPQVLLVDPRGRLIAATLVFDEAGIKARLREAGAVLAVNPVNSMNIVRTRQQDEREGG